MICSVINHSYVQSDKNRKNTEVTFIISFQQDQSGIVISLLLMSDNFTHQEVISCQEKVIESR